MEKSPYEMFITNQWSWRQLVTHYEEELNDLEVPDEINHDDIMRLDVAADRFYRVFRKDFARVSTRLDKIQRALKRAEREGAVAGKNDADRKANAIQFAKNYPLEDETGQRVVVNLYDLEDQYLAYYEFFKYVDDVIKRKDGVLIRSLGCVKVAKDLSV